MRDSVPSPPLATQTPSVPAAMPSGPRPTWTVLFTATARGSILEMVPSARFVTQSAPAPTATASGSTPTPIRDSTGLDRGSSATTVADDGDATQMRRKPTATPEAPTTAGNVFVRLPLAGAMRDTVPSAEFVTQTPPSP
jgi:hypothetical protein